MIYDALATKKVGKMGKRPVALFVEILSRVSSFHGHRISFLELCPVVQLRLSRACRGLPDLQR